MTITNYMRLGTASSYDTVLANISNQQSKLAQLQNELSTGKKIVNPSDDPTGAAQAERDQARMDRIASDQRALQAQQTSISMAESTLGDVTSALQSFRDLVVSAGDASQTASDRKTIQVQLQGIRDQILNMANQTDANGRPLFAALGSALTPFVAPTTAAQGYTFQGLPGQSSSTAVTIPYALDGNAAFMSTPSRDGVYNVTVGNAGGPIPAGRLLTTNSVTVSNAALANGSGYTISITNVDTTTTPGSTIVHYSVTESPSGNVSNQVAPAYLSTQNASIAVQGMPGLSLNINGNPAVGDTISVAPQTSIFSTLDNAINDIGNAANPNAATQAVAQALNNLDTGMAKVSAVRGVAGDLLNRASVINTNEGQRSTQLTADQSAAQDLDMVKGISDFQTQQTGYQAALQSYASVKKVNLFNFLS